MNHPFDLRRTFLSTPVANIFFLIFFTINRYVYFVRRISIIEKGPLVVGLKESYVRQGKVYFKSIERRGKDVCVCVCVSERVYIVVTIAVVVRYIIIRKA